MDARSTRVRVLLGEVKHADAVLARGGEVELGGDGAEEIVGDGAEDAGAVAGVLLAAARAAMGHADEHLERLGDILAGGGLVELAHESHAAGVAVVRGVEKALGWSEGLGEKVRGGVRAEREVARGHDRRPEGCRGKIGGEGC